MRAIVLVYYRVFVLSYFRIFVLTYYRVNGLSGLRQWDGWDLDSL